jgi:hypothetical protein
LCLLKISFDVGSKVQPAMRCYETVKIVKRKSFTAGGKIRKKGGELIMKARVMSLSVLLFAGFLISSCATLDRYNTEYEEEMTSVEKMTPQEKADWETEQHENFMIDMKGYFGDGE